MGLCRAVLHFYSKDELPGKLFKLVLVIWACFAWISLAVVLVLYLSGRPCFMELIQQENGSYIIYDLFLLGLFLLPWHYADFWCLS